MKCYNCNKKLKEDRIVCPRCGAPVQESGAARQPRAGAEETPPAGAYGPYVPPQQYQPPQQQYYQPPEQSGYTPPQEATYTAPEQPGYTPPPQGYYAPPEQAGYTPPQQGYYPPPGYYAAPGQPGYMPQQGYYPQVEPAPSGWWKLVGLVAGIWLPLVALIIYFVLKESRPKTASMFKKFAWIGFAIAVTFWVLVVVAMVMLMIFNPYWFDFYDEYSYYSDSFFALLPTLGL